MSDAINMEENYLMYVEKQTPKTGWFNSLFHAFIVGGMICCLGQMFGDIIKAYNPDMDILRVGSWSSIIIITITILLTAFGVFDRIAKFGGAGTFIPISGFANSIASCAIEFKNEGLVFGIGAKMFYVAGPVLVNGVAYSIVVGLVYSLILLFWCGSFMKRLGKQTLEVEGDCYVLGRGALVGEKEKNGTYKKYMKNSVSDDKMGEKSFEKGERKMLDIVNSYALKDAKIKEKDVQLYLGGDLMNQLVSSNYIAEKMQVPYVGVYSACSTITATLGLGACLMDAGGFDNILCATISHFSSAERLYRYPLEFGNQRQCYSQWTVTAGGAFVLSSKKSFAKIDKICFGRVQDFGVVDIANMGAAMAPAACDTLCNFFADTKTTPEDYDFIATGDLGKLGSDILRDLIAKRGYELKQNYADLGHTIYSFEEESYQGGSGAGCSASILATYIMDKIKDKTFSKVLLVATGALMSTVTNQQGDSIPAIAHLIEFVGV